MNEKELDMFAQAMTECAYSNQGCNRLPVRLVCVINDDPSDDANADMVLLCIKHAPLYVPTGQVVFDKTLPEDNLQFIREVGI